jgi:RNA polymerase sigma factor (sigma-70 family)
MFSARLLGASVDDSSASPGWDEAPTEAANLVILLLPEENWQVAGDSPGPGSILIVGSGLLPAERRVLPAADPEFATCYHAEMPALIAFLIKCGANHDDAADAAQEAFTELFKQWQAVRKPKQWLRTVAFRIFLHQQVGNTSPLETVQDILSPLSASARFEFREEEELVLNVLDLLPTIQRAVLALHYDQFDTRDIAEILGMKQAAVRKNLERARATLKKSLYFSGGHLRLRREPPAEGAENEPHE